MQTGLTIFEATKDHVVATFHHVVITLFARETTAAGAMAIRRAVESIGARHPDGLALLTIVAEGSPLPGDQVREDLAEAMRFGGKRGVRRSAVYFEGDGFRAAAVRGVTTGLILVAKQPFPHQVFKSIEEAVTWLAPELGVREFLCAVDMVRDSLQPRSVGR